ncbi:MAG: S41 family peptidase [Rhodospirillales bacterium]|mgnify:CR=1 FL=1|jgi:carboxyl-terminal processing protease|nr:S41 family peptidase [Rhodospirillales bacterium]
MLCSIMQAIPYKDKAIRSWLSYTGKAFAILFFGLIFILLSGCTGVFAPSSKYQSDQAERVFSAGFETIQDKYIEALQPVDFALHGVENIDVIDPELNVTVANAVVHLTRGTAKVETFTTPQSGDAHGWGRFAARFIKTARKASPLLRKASAETIYKAVFNGALDTLDVPSRYAGLESAQDYRAKRDGFGGIGIRLNFHHADVEIIAIMPGTPAEKSLLRAGDIITHVDNTPVKGLANRQIIQMLRGKVGTDALILVKRKGRAPLRVNLTRAHIVSQTVHLKRVGHLAIIRITRFNHHTTRNLTRTLKRIGNHPHGIILDLRGNPGGLLDQAVSVSDLFLKSGNIVSTRGRHPESFQLFKSTDHEMAANIPMVVLINGQSASSSEIVATALQDHGRAVVIGTNSYGKGTVQNISRLPNGGEMILTWARFHTPSGYMLEQLGTMPNICTSFIEHKDIALSDPDGNRWIRAHIQKQITENIILLSAWRTHLRFDKKSETNLRQKCPKQTEKSGFDLKIAKYLLENKVLYAQVLGSSMPAIAHSKTH